jgi:hypothetical protein
MDGALKFVLLLKETFILQEIFLVKEGGVWA